MAALVVQSRFAGLKIEDDDYPSSDSQKSNKKSKINTEKKPEPQKKQLKTNNKQSASKKKRSKQNSTAEQWALWKLKDEELVDGNYESELQQALVLSKIDYEEKKDVYKQMKKEAEKKQIDQVTRANTKKQKKKNVMSLDQFNDMMNDSPKCPPEDNKDPIDEDIKPLKKDKEFFERMTDETRNELLKAKIVERVKHRQTVPDEIITKVQYAEALERKEKEIVTLREEVVKLKQELITVKGRNKKLCNILGQGEMKDKAEVLVEVERLRAVQAELTSELATLHTDLEKERSRNTDPRSKDKRTIKKKCIRFDVSTEAILAKESSFGAT